MKILTLEERALRAELSSIEKSQLPNLSLSGSLSYGDSQTLGNNISSGRISLSSNLILYSGGQKKARVKIASNKLAAKAIDIAVRKKTLQRDITTKWLDLVALKSSVIAKQEETNALNELYESVFEEWRLGGKTSLDTDQAYQNFLNSDVELVTSTTDILIAKFDLLAEIGTLRISYSCDNRLIAMRNVMAQKKTAKKEKKENGKVDLKEILGDIKTVVSGEKETLFKVSEYKTINLKRKIW